MRCLITGCCVHHLKANRFAHGDLFGVGDCYAFHAVQNGSQGTRWFAAVTSPWIAVIMADDFFDHEGVIVVPKRLVILNDAAKKHAYGEGAVTL